MTGCLFTPTMNYSMDITNDQLVAKIKQELLKGQKREDITAVLLEKGYKLSAINHLFSRIASEESVPINQKHHNDNLSFAQKFLYPHKVFLFVCTAFFIIIPISIFLFDFFIDAHSDRVVPVTTSMSGMHMDSSATGDYVANSTIPTTASSPTSDDMGMIMSSPSGFSYFNCNAPCPADSHDEIPAQMDPVHDSDLNNISPMAYLTTWNFSNLSPLERSKYYQETKLPDGTMKREYWFYVEVKTIRLANNITFTAWTYDGQVPGPTMRATEGDTIIVHLINQTPVPHSIHFHTYHAESMDSALASQQVQPGKSATYTFTAAPFGLQLYHCHQEPIAEHMNEGMYGVFIIDPKHDVRPKPDKELVMVMNAFDLTDTIGDESLIFGDGNNNVYALNSVAFYYRYNPIPVKVGKLTRIYLVNATEFDPINSFHIHGNFFWDYPTGTQLKPSNFTDTIILGQAERAVLDVQFHYPGLWMFHSHKEEFTEKGWMGYFNAEP